MKFLETYNDTGDAANPEGTTGNVSHPAKKSPTAHTEIKYGNVSILDELNTARVGEKEIKLNRKEYGILKYLISRPLQVVDKRTIACMIWADGYAENNNFDPLYVQIAGLRKKLEETGANISIMSVYGSGYKLVKKGPGR